MQLLQMTVPDPEHTLYYLEQHRYQEQLKQLEEQLRVNLDADYFKWKDEQEEQEAAEEKEKQRIHRYNRRVYRKPEWKSENTTSNSRKHNSKCKKGMK